MILMRVGAQKIFLANPKPARIPPQTPPAGGKSAEAGRIHSPRQIVSPCRVRISNFNHWDFARNSFELCPTNTARIKMTPQGRFNYSPLYYFVHPQSLHQMTWLRPALATE